MTRRDPPDGIDPVGISREHDGHEMFVVLLAVVVAVLGLVFTLGWVVFHHLTA